MIKVLKIRAGLFKEKDANGNKILEMRSVDSLKEL
jgi:hypothetical protein